MFLKQVDQTKYGSLVTGLDSQHSLSNDQYPKTMSETTNVLSNHRFDQTLLSVLIYQSGLDVVPMTERVAVERSTLSQDPHEPSNKIVYSARGSSQEYAMDLYDRHGQFRYRMLRNRKIE